MGHKYANYFPFKCGIIESLFFRYSVTCDLGQGHLILGKIIEPSVLTSVDLVAIQGICSNLDQQTAKIYHRALISGIVYTTANYARSKVRKDNILCFDRSGQKIFGNAQQYVSFCTNQCTQCPQPCKHVVLIHQFTEIQTNISDDTLTGATGKQVHCVYQTRHVIYIYIAFRFYIYIHIIFSLYIVKSRHTLQERYAASVFTYISTLQM